MTDTESKPTLDFPELESGGPGAPGVPSDEFANIPSSRRRHPVLALAAAVLAVFLIYQVHEDLFFALSSASPTDLGDARALADKPIAGLPLNRMVRISGMADRESGVIIDTAGSWKFKQFFRLLGTRSRVFVSRVPDPIPVEQAEKDVFVGRLLPFRDLSYADAIRKHFANRVMATHFFSPAGVKAQLAGAVGGPLVMTDLLGEKVSLAADDELYVDVSRPADVQVDLPRSKFRDLAAARAAVEGKGATVLDDTLKPSDDKSLSLVITFPAERRDQVMSAIADLDLHVRYRPLRTTYSVKVGELAAGKDAGGDGLVLKTGGERKTLRLDQIMAIRTSATVQIPDGALLLSEGDRPSEHYRTIVVVIFLLGFAALNLSALRSRG